MKNINIKILTVSACITLVCGAHANINSENPLVNTNREAVSFSWLVTDNYPTNPGQALSHTEESVEYWQMITGNELAKGVEISTTAPGALIRISELSMTKREHRSNPGKGIQPLQLEIVDSKGEKFTHGKAMSMDVSPQAMRNAGSPFPNGTAGFKLKSSLGKGQFKIRNTSSTDPDSRFTLHVFDKDSHKRLSLTREKTDFTLGEELKLSGTFTDSETGSATDLAISELSAFLVTPHGNTIPLTAQNTQKGQYTVSAALDMQPEYGGLYEAYIDALSNEGGIEIKRRVKTAFAVVKPTAKLDKVSSGTLKHGLPVNIRVAEAGRYEVRGVLYATDKSGNRQAVMAASSAQWLEPLDSTIKISFDQDLLLKHSLSAPYEFRHLQLLDQSRMGKLDMSEVSISIIE